MPLPVAALPTKDEDKSELIQTKPLQQEAILLPFITASLSSTIC